MMSIAMRRVEPVKAPRLSREDRDEVKLHPQPWARNCFRAVFVLALAAAVLLMTLAAGCYLAFSANAAGLLPLNHAGSVRLAYVAGIAGGACFNCSMPLMFELMMEQVYGWGDDGIASMLSVLTNTLVQVAFLVLAAVSPASLTGWISWLNAAAMGSGCVALLATRVEYRRHAVDRGVPLAEAGCAFDRKVGCL